MPPRKLPTDASPEPPFAAKPRESIREDIFGEPLGFGEIRVDYEPLVVIDYDDVKNGLLEEDDPVVYFQDDGDEAAALEEARARRRAVQADLEDAVYVEDDAAEDAPAPGAGDAAPAPPLFPEEAADRVRRRAWAEYAQSLAGEEGSGVRRRRRTPPPSPVRSWAELAGSLGLLALVNFLFFPDDVGFRRFEFNPYLLPALLFGVRYGPAHGLFAGLVGAAWAVHGAGGFHLEDGSLILPGFLTVAGAFAGLLSRRQGRRLYLYRARSWDLEAEVRGMVRTLAAKDAVIRDLQSRIEEYGVSLENLYRMGRGMTSENPDELYATVLRILARDLRAERASVYDVTDAGLAFRSGHDERLLSDAFPPALGAEGTLAGLALRLGRAVSAFDPEAAERQSGAVLAGLVREGGRVRAVVLVERMPLLEFSPAAVSRFAALLDWASETRTRAARREDRRTPGWFDERIGAYTTPYLLDAVAKETGRSQRYGTPFSVLLVQILGYDGLPPTRRATVRQSVCRVLSAHTRETDAVCATPREDAFAVLLPMHLGGDAVALADRVNTVLEQLWPRGLVRLAFSFADLSGPPAGVEEVLQKGGVRP
jgi:GGDEF domain-containing protein